MSLAKSNVEKEAMQSTLQEFQDKFSDLGVMKTDMIQAGMNRARQAALQRQEVTSSLRKSASSLSTLNKVVDKSKSNIKRKTTKTLRKNPNNDENNGKIESEGKKERNVNETSDEMVEVTQKQISENAVVQIKKKPLNMVKMRRVASAPLKKKT